MQVLLYAHEASDAHDTGRGHPERPARVEAAVAGVRMARAQVIDRSPPEATRAELAAVHTDRYVTAIERFCRSGGGALDADTIAVAASWPAALRSAGAGPAAVADLRVGAADAAFLALRPPGHHALANQAMGFCIFNNIAVTAALLADAGERVAIVDWDVHHGNGTQTTFFERDDVLYLSFHEYPAYPGTGWLDENGIGQARGTTINFPFPAGTAGDAYVAAMDRVGVPVLKAFDADWTLVSAGYDAHAADPLASIRLVADDYAALAARVSGVTKPGRLLYFLEGGYDLAAIKASVAATIDGSGAGDAPAEPSATYRSPTAAYRVIDLVATEIRRFWEVG